MGAIFVCVGKHKLRPRPVRNMFVRHNIQVMLVASLVAGAHRAAVAFQSRSAVQLRFSQSPSIAARMSPSYRICNSRLFGDLQEEVDPGKVEGIDFQIVKYPHPALRAENSKVTKEELKDGSIQKLSKDMFQYMYEAEGVGLAAPQVGVNKCLMVYNPTGDKKRWLDEVVLVNPRIVEFSESKEVDVEGCLSFPDMSGDVERSKWIKVEATNLRGKMIKRKYTGWEARIFQHGKAEFCSALMRHYCLRTLILFFYLEYDHLDGIVYIDRLSEKEKEKVQSRLDELIEEFGEGGAL